MKKRWVNMFILFALCLFCFNAKASAQECLEVKSGKTTYYVKEGYPEQIYKKVSGKSKVLIKMKTNESVKDLVCVYKDYLYYTKGSWDSEGSYASLVKYGIKTKKTTVIKKVKSDDSSTVYADGSIYIHYTDDKYSNIIYSYNCKTKKYKQFVKTDKITDSDPLLGVYGNYIYFYRRYTAKDGKDYSLLKKCAIKNKKVTTIKKYKQIIDFRYYKGFIAINYGWSDSIFISDGFAIYNCKKNTFKRVTKHSTAPYKVDGKWYYVEEVSKGKIYIMKCDLEGKNPKKVKKISSKFDRVEKMGKDKMYYYDTNDKLHKVTY